jgi:hypothetical protein
MAGTDSDPWTTGCDTTRLVLRCSPTDRSTIYVTFLAGWFSFNLFRLGLGRVEIKFYSCKSNSEASQRSYLNTTPFAAQRLEMLNIYSPGFLQLGNRQFFSCVISRRYH